MSLRCSSLLPPFMSPFSSSLTHCVPFIRFFACQPCGDFWCIFFFFGGVGGVLAVLGFLFSRRRCLCANVRPTPSPGPRLLPWPRTSMACSRRWQNREHERQRRAECVGKQRSLPFFLSCSLLLKQNLCARRSLPMRACACLFSQPARRGSRSVMGLHGWCEASGGGDWPNGGGAEMFLLVPTPLHVALLPTLHVSFRLCPCSFYSR